MGLLPLLTGASCKLLYETPRTAGVTWVRHRCEAPMRHGSRNRADFAWRKS